MVGNIHSVESDCCCFRRNKVLFAFIIVFQYLRQGKKPYNVIHMTKYIDWRLCFKLGSRFSQNASLLSSTELKREKLAMITEPHNIFWVKSLLKGRWAEYLEPHLISVFVMAIDNHCSLRLFVHYISSLS